MPDFPFHFRVSDYLTEHGQIIQAKRGFLLCELPGLPLVCDAFLDTAAPFCVIPYTLSRQVAWQQVATRLSPLGGGVSSPLLWQGIPCELGTITLRLIHLSSSQRSNPVQALAKFPLRPLAPPLERAVVLGLSLLDQNDLRLLMERIAGALTGILNAP